MLKQSLGVRSKRVVAAVAGGTGGAREEGAAARSSSAPPAEVPLGRATKAEVTWRADGLAAAVAEVGEMEARHETELAEAVADAAEEQVALVTEAAPPC